MSEIKEGALVIYKSKPAIVNEKAENKFTISLKDGSSVKVRDKDIELIHPGPVKNFIGIEEGHLPPSAVKEVWELLCGEGEAVSLKDLSSFIFNEYTPESMYGAYCLLCDGIYFTGAIDAVIPRGKEEVAAEESKRAAVQRESGERSQFLDRLKACLKKPAENKMLDDDTRFIQDVEALAYGRSPRSRTMRDMGLGETPQDAHSLLLKTGFWTAMVNPHPSRFGLPSASPTVCPSLPDESAHSELPPRRDLTHLPAFAIDSPWSNDPDDAVSIEEGGGGVFILYVHVADPASCIAFGSPAEKEARDRGATLYLPEGASRMLAEECIPMFALGLYEKSLALTFKLTVNENGMVIDTEIFPSIVKVSRLTYEEADREIDAQGAAQTLGILYNLSKKIFERRTLHGAVNIELPDVNITVKGESVTIEPIVDYRSSFIVKECMIAAGEGAGTWAASRGLAFPYISQEVEIQGKVPGGLAGAIQLRKCMRPRILSVKPGRHQGLGLDTYTQVTSPLRRYTDLLSHIQIRAVLRGDKPLSADDISARLGFSEAGAVAAVHAERAAENHWKMVYLSDKKESLWDAAALENKGRFWSVIIPALALETQVSLQRDISLNDNIKLMLKSVNIAKGEAVFQQC